VHARPSRLPQPKTREAPIGDDQHAGLELPDQSVGQLPVAGPPRAHPRRHDGMRAALPEPDQVDLRERGRVLRPARTAERLPVLRRIGHVQHEPVDGHQPPRPQPPAAVPRPRAGDSDPLEQHPQRFGPQPLPRLTDRARGRHPPIGPPGAQVLQAVDQLAHHLLVRVTEEQAQRHHVVHHHPSRQQPRPFLHPAGLGEHLVNKVTMHQPRQHPDANDIGQPAS
jgi:hypothetical protein